MPAQTGPTLSDIAYVSRLALKYGSIFLVVFMVGRILLNASIALYKQMNPAKPPPPTLGFGTLPAPDFGENLATPKEYQLQTVTGGLPSFPNQAKVFFMPDERASLLAVDHAKKQAAALGFVFPYEQVSQTLLRWRKTTPIASMLEIDIVTGDVNMKVDWSGDPAFLLQKNLPEEDSAKQLAKSTLIQAGLLPLTWQPVQLRFLF